MQKPFKKFLFKFLYVGSPSADSPRPKPPLTYNGKKHKTQNAQKYHRTKFGQYSPQFVLNRARIGNLFYGARFEILLCVFVLLKIKQSGYVVKVTV